MIEIEPIVTLHTDTVVRWHSQAIDNPYEGFLSLVCLQHSFNFRLWHEEDLARCPNASDQQIADVKRKIDKYNQQRNDCIEKLDDTIGDMLQRHGVEDQAKAPLNTETPGSATDRLSILSLRIYHLEEQSRRQDASEEHLNTVSRRLAVCFAQQADLSKSLQQLLDDLFAGRKRHVTYRQLKMYNDPTFNPYLYKSKKRLAG